MLKRENCMFHRPLASFPLSGAAFHGGGGGRKGSACLPLGVDATQRLHAYPASDTRAKTAERDAAAGWNTDERTEVWTAAARRPGYAVWPREEIKADNVYSEGSPRRRAPAPMNNTGYIFLDIAAAVFDTTLHRRCVTITREKESLT